MALDPFTAALDLGRSIVDRVLPDRAARERMELEQALLGLQQAHQSALAQVEVNKVEAAHRSLFVAGWRPSIGWGCSLSLLYAALVQPALVAAGVAAPEPHFIDDNLMELVFAMLGFGGLRTFEKARRVS